MCDSTAFVLLRALQENNRLDTSLDLERPGQGERRWLITARSADGHIWRSEHSNLLWGVVMLHKMIADSVRVPLDRMGTSLR